MRCLLPSRIYILYNPSHENINSVTCSISNPPTPPSYRQHKEKRPTPCSLGRTARFNSLYRWPHQTVFRMVSPLLNTNGQISYCSCWLLCRYTAQNPFYMSHLAELVNLFHHFNNG